VGQRWLLGRKLSGPRKEKEKGKNGSALGWVERRRERKRGFGFFFLFSFQPFTQKNLFKFSKIILKTFKPQNQTKAHAFNMMHKHLGVF
jgi:hypothetical protein